MDINETNSLKAYNTFAVGARAHRLLPFATVEQLTDALEQAGKNEVMILGGGSNVLFTRDYPGLVLKNNIGGIETLHEDADHVYIRAGAGVNWQQFVQHTIDRDLGGVENLSLIPGNCGASPMQNIGAYGVEVKDVFHELEALDLRNRTIHTFTNNDCDFGYRESVFKNKYKGRFVILTVTYRLNKFPRLNTSYGAITQELARMGAQPSVRTISEAVIRIRRSKLPDPATIGNAGSFFKNPVVDAATFRKLHESNPLLPSYPQTDGTTKLAAGWLIEQCGWKGYREGDAGVHQHQALVLVNYGNATGREIFQLSEKVVQSVKTRFGITLEREVNII